LPKFRLSGAAKRDLKEIASYTLRVWGKAQMWKYTRELTQCCGLLATEPELGRHCESLAPGLRRFETGKHVIFYLREPDRIDVVRILHQQTLPAPGSFVK
jgi:toxin ParE1/3/4